MTEMSIITREIKNFLKSASGVKFKLSSAPLVDPIKDHIFNMIQTKVSKTAHQRFSFNVLSHVIFTNQRPNPSFTACYILKDHRSIEDSSWAASCFFRRSHSPFNAFHKHVHKIEGADSKPDPFETIWGEIPSDTTGANGVSVKSADKIVGGLTLRNVDAILSFTHSRKPKHPDQKKQRQEKKKDTQTKKTHQGPSKQAIGKNKKGKKDKKKPPVKVTGKGKG